MSVKDVKNLLYHDLHVELNPAVSQHSVREKRKYATQKLIKIWAD